jgi:hypothetical protein
MFCVAFSLSFERTILLISLLKKLCKKGETSWDW